MTRMHAVALLDFPVAQYVRMQQHHDALLRELSLIALGQSSSTAVPERLADLSKEIFERYRDGTGPFRQRLSEAVAKGDVVSSLQLRIPLQTLRWSEDFLLLVEEADEFCRTGHLLTAPSPPDIADFRRWLVGELIRQVRDGAPATPYWTEAM